MHKPQLFITINQALTDIAGTVKPEHLEVRMPSYASAKQDATMRDELNIFTYENLCVPKVLAGESGLATNAEFTEDYLGDNYLDSYRQHADTANAAVAAHDDWQRTVHISYGDFPAEGYITDICLNRALGIFDIARVTGAKPVLDETVVRELYDITKQYVPMLREYGIFPPEVAVAGNAPLIDRLQGLTGRRPL